MYGYRQIVNVQGPGVIPAPQTRGPDLPSRTGQTEILGV